MTTRTVKVYQNLMGENRKWAGRIRRILQQENILMLNLIGSPGSGKTSLLEKLAERGAKPEFAVLEGDIETTRDAERLAALGVIASQLLSGGSCHLEAKLVHRALVDLPLKTLDIVFVENVGNLVCPAEFDVGEHAKVAVLSVTEGEDKPLKYPLLFRESKAVVLTKIDLLPHLTYDIDLCRRNIAAVNAAIPIFEVSCRTGHGIDEWIGWIRQEADKLEKNPASG